MNNYLSTREIPVKDPYRDEPTCCAPEKTRGAVGNLVELRKLQYETIERLCLLVDDLAGSVTVKEHQEMLAKFDGDVQGLINLTTYVCEQSRAISMLVNECRELIGA